MEKVDILDITKQRKSFNPEKRKTMLFFAYISPWLIGLTLFTLVPICISFVLSFTNTSMMNFSSDPWEFVGIDNYLRIFREDATFLRALLNTFIYAFVKVFLLVIIALLIALLLNKKIVGRKVFRVLIYLPSIIPVVSVALLWKMIFTGGEYNIVNYVLSFFGFYCFAGRYRCCRCCDLCCNEKVFSLFHVLDVWQMINAGVCGEGEGTCAGSASDGARRCRLPLRATLP